MLRRSKKCFPRTLKNMQESKKDRVIPNIVKGYFFFGTSEKNAIRKKIQLVKYFVSREKNFSQRVEIVAL